MALVSNDIILKHVDTMIPRWRYETPTPMLEAKGLTPSALKQIIATINKRAEDRAHEKCNPRWRYYAWIPCIGVIIALILLVVAFASSDELKRSLGPIAAVILIAFLTAFVCTFCCVSFGRRRAKRGALQRVKAIVEVTLNAQWMKTRGVRWTFVSEQKVSTHGVGRNQEVQVRNYYHIGIRALQMPMGPQYVQQPRMHPAQMMTPMQQQNYAPQMMQQQHQNQMMMMQPPPYQTNIAIQPTEQTQMIPTTEGGAPDTNV
uniref:Uncharacterized protein n=1 Tax=Elphidium margaritaceum TaxID=933848 RepID=A0A7S0TDY9_9EUKA|mmetsp:Transcript_163/g.239  ORF Transcript_163/g.239 Transcript_163/m.239 type:complete len:260 (+) Transcript_163:33-812(+)